MKINSGGSREERQAIRITDLDAEIAVMRSVLESCLEDYGNPRFTDRHGMANRIRNALGKALVE